LGFAVVKDLDARDELLGPRSELLIAHAAFQAAVKMYRAETIECATLSALRSEVRISGKSSVLMWRPDQESSTVVDDGIRSRRRFLRTRAAMAAPFSSPATSAVLVELVFRWMTEGAVTRP
jgi:hypothetical protein